MGTPDFSVGTLRELAKAGHEIAGVISQPDKPKGRGKNLQPTPVKEAAMELGLPVYQPKKVRDPEFIQMMRELNPDVIVVVAFGQIIPKEILHMPKYGCINVHASLLPAYRGAAPIQWAVINGDKESGVTIMRMDEGLDTGDMISKVIVPLNEKETGGSLFDRLSESGAKLLVDTLPMLEDGSAVFEKQPEKAVRFLGFNTVPTDVYEVKDDAAFRKAVREFAQAARRQGYNLFRVNTLQDYLPRKPKQDRVVDPRWLDRFEYLLAELKKEGIYIQLVLTAQNPFFAPERRGEAHWYRDLYKMLFYLGEGPLMDAFQYTLSLMNRVNPHTGLAWKDDPAIVLVEFCNEQYAAFSYLAKFAHKFPKLFQSVEDEWNRRLTEKYGKRIPENIREGTPEGKPVPIPANQYGNSPAANEFTLFLQELTAANNRRCTELLRKAGYPGLVSQNNYRTLFSSAATQETMPVVDDHCYFAHPTRAVFTGAASSWMTSGSHVPAESSVAKAADYFRGLFTGRLYGKPFFVGEYNHCFWNPYLHEAGAVFGAYAAFQNFSGCAIFSAPVQQKPRPAQTMNNFLAGINPVMRANEAIAYFLFRRGDVAPARHSAILAIPRRMLESGGGGRGAISSEQSKIALMTGFGVLFPELAGGNVLRKPDCTLAPAGVAAIEDHDWFVSTVESASSRSSADSVAAELKRRGILPETNRSEPSKGIFESDTGELLMNTREKLFRAVTPRSETVSLPANRKVQLNHLAVSGSSIPATVSLHALDSQVLNRSRHMLLIYATATANSGMILSEDGATMTTPGVQPTLLRTGRLSFALDNVHAAEFALYALAMDGSRIQELPFNIRNGKCEVVINTAELRAGTVFFEFARKQK